MLTVHYLIRSRAHRLLWLLEELGLDYEIKVYQRDPVSQLAMPEMQAVHPTGKSPVITDGDVTLAESGAIFDYALTRYGNGRLVPQAGTPEWVKYLYFMHASEGTAQSLAGQALALNMVTVRASDAIKAEVGQIVEAVRGIRVDPYLERTFDLWERMLGDSEWLTGSGFTAADIMAEFTIEIAGARLGALVKRPRLAALRDRSIARPAYQRAAQKGGFEPF